MALLRPLLLVLEMERAMVFLFSTEFLLPVDRAEAPESHLVQEQSGLKGSRMEGH